MARKKQSNMFFMVVTAALLVLAVMGWGLFKGKTLKEIFNPLDAHRPAVSEQQKSFK
ncbi:hypothetical protein ACFL3M_02515 [Patescibacteria group bacterium]